MGEPERFWFPAKRYGWGWGLPITWQGWMAFAIFILLLMIGAFLFPPARDILSFLVYTVVVSVVFSGVCYTKGEPPSWHWDDK